jgi:hypothetical protein
MAASTVVPLKPAQKAAFLSYYKNIQSNQQGVMGLRRSRFQLIDKNYQRELDRTQENQRAKAANTNGDPTRFQNMVVPVVMPQVEAAVVHQTSVFLTGSPIFGVVAGPAFIDEALQMESVLEANSIRGGWARQLMMSFRDGAKYNFMPIEASWGREVTWAVETSVQKNLKEGTPVEVIWTGNTLTRLDPYNTFYDNKVAAADVYRYGEYAGYTQFFSRIRLKSFIAELPDKIISSIVPAFESGKTSAPSGGGETLSYFVPDVNPAILDDNFALGETDWLAWANLAGDKKSKIDYKDSYEVTTLYCKILPSEFGLVVPNSNTPTIYKIILVNHEHIIYAELQTNAHNWLPILIGAPQEDGLDTQTKSLAENGIPFQQLATSYMTSIIESRRRAINDRVLFDPSRITAAHINSPNASAKIPVRPAAYGKKISDAVYQFPFRADQDAGAMQQIQGIVALANVTNGQNQAQQGQFTKGNRTLEEFDTIMQNANGRDQLVSILIEHQTFMPMKQIFKLNILQFQGGTTVYNRDKDVAVEIDPVKLRLAVLDFRVSDGLTPASKLLNSEAFGAAMQALGQNPQLGAGYNMAPMFSYFMKTQGAKISEFEKSPEQVAYEQAVTQWQQIAQFAIENEQPFTQPQPLPEQFGYDPAGNTPSTKPTEPASNTQGTA